MRLGVLKAVGEASLSAGVMILAVLVLRTWFQERTPRRAFCLLWDIVLVRLLIPGALPSPVSIRRWLPGPAAETAVSRDVQALEAVVMDAGLAPRGEWSPMVYLTEDTAACIQTVQAPAPPDWGTILTVLWLGIALLLAGGFFWSHLRSRRIYAASLPCREEFVLDWLAEHPLLRPVQARISDRVAAPLTYGALYPVILLPAGMDWEDRETLACVLAHEHTHIRRFDALRKAFLAAALCLHWFNPLAWVMYVLSNRDVELTCDEAVLRGGADRERYALALLGLEERRGRWTPFGSHFSGHALEERIKAIMKRKHISIAALAAVLVVMCVATAVFATAVPKDKAKIDEVVMLSSDAAVRPDPADSGRNWVNLDQYNAKYTSWSEGWQAEWWTYVDYKAWLEQERENLQGIIGEKGYAGSTGWFTWDQKRVDEAIATYEAILADIKNGALYAKAIVDKNGREVEGAVLGSGGKLEASVFTPALSDITDEFAALLEEAEAFGVTREGDKLYYEGQLVRTLVDGDGCWYGNDNGTVDLQVQRNVFMGSDGYWNTSGAVSGILSERDAGFDRTMTDLFGIDDMVWRIYGTGAPVDADAIEAAFARYEKYGLVYLPRECGIGSMSYCGQPVRSFEDVKPDGGAFSYQDPNVERGLTVTTLYDQDGKLAGLSAE